MDASAPDIWIVNSSPFIGLAKVGRLGLLAALGRVVYLPETVVREVRAGEADDLAVRAAMPSRLAEVGLGVLPAAPLEARLSAFRLDAGEAAVLTEALARPGSLAVIDDGPGRAAAVALGVSLTGTLGVLIRARRAGRLAALAPVIRDLKAVGIFLPGDAALRALLAPFGELWP